MEDLLKETILRNTEQSLNTYTDRQKNTANAIDPSIDLRGLYSTLKEHPALMDRRLKIGGRVPPPIPESDLARGVQSRSKRSIFDIGVAQPICPFTTEWVQIRNARDLNNTEVVVFQPSDDNPNSFQWFYTVTCDYESLLSENDDCPLCCRAVNHRRYSSQCIPRKTSVMAYISKQLDSNGEFDWGYIQVDSSCNCAVTRRPF
ncbi:venom nerve growth factor 3-like [Ruditapes philippinarum]|uniref:venom nerve growth factor 3-like n=1 Tax=Ruditapes philippinarum TaxID=129788 RepID=UPI00295C268B|nr:venom nerve growth factor 3-like [Ruditapes philippinarum]